VTVKIVISLLLAFGIGVTCRLAGIPVPAPPAIVGALLVLAMTSGYLLADRFAQGRPKANDSLCGGPTGVSTARER
jgi:XapX domain-containing protein